MAALEVAPVSGALGAEIRGVDLETLTDDQFAEIKRILLRYLVIFFPDQGELSPEAHVAFGRRFGEVESAHPYLPHVDGHPEIVLIDSEQGGKVDVWHTDMTFTAQPPMCSILHMIKTPSVGGDTMWTNQCLAYESLSAPLREFVDGLTAIHGINVPDAEFESRAEHPVVRVHPETGRRSLYVNRLFTSHIPQLNRNESDALLDYLIDFAEQPQFFCRFRWQPGAVAVWDNRTTQHYAVNDYTEPRLGQRITVLGDQPTAAVEPRWPHYAAAPWERYWPRRINAITSY